MSDPAEPLPPDVCFGLFAKHWEPGKVKTRLAASLGDGLAASVYRVFLETLLWRFGSAENDTGSRAESVIVYTPENRDVEFRELSSSAIEQKFWKLQPQGDGDLGDRLHRFFASRFASGHSNVIVIGTDSPTLPSSFLHQAKWLLDKHDVVLGPTEDGGYYLVAAKHHVPPIFREITWSTEKVWSQTIAKLQNHRLTFAVLPTWYDVDNIEDLQRLRAEIFATIHAPAKIEQVAIANRLNKALQSILDE